MRTTIAIAALAFSLAACGETTEVDTDAADELASEESEQMIEAEALNASDFADLMLGARIEGPEGEEVTGRMENEAGAFADIRSFVACPDGFQACDPQVAPAGTVYTYVHTVYPGEDNDPSTGSGTGNDSSDVETVEAFRMTMPSHGFNGVAGYSHAEAAAALGERGAIVITCHEGGIAWTVEEGDGGDQWEQSEPITFFWQSLVPPAGPAQAYEIFANYTAAQGRGPYPAEQADVPNVCDPLPGNGGGGA